MPLPFGPPLTPMLSAAQNELPRGDGWCYEPKWDGFRALVFRDGGSQQIISRKGQPLGRYFPELEDIFREPLPESCVVDGEIIIASGAGLDFEALQLRLHPAESRVRKLAAETPSSFVAFDLLALGGTDLRDRRLSERRAELESAVLATDGCFVTPQTDDPDVAQSWFERFEGAGLDGIIAKRAELPYVPGERVMVKVKHQRTADCVVGGYRLSKDGTGIGSLLLGLYADGSLQYVGHTSSFKAAERRELLEQMRAIEGPSFGEGRSPGGPSRWNSGRPESEWFPVKPLLVCEVAFDHLQGIRFRHASRFLRWRTDKDPHECTFDQILPPEPFKLSEIRRLAAR